MQTLDWEKYAINRTYKELQSTIYKCLQLNNKINPIIKMGISPRFIYQGPLSP